MRSIPFFTQLHTLPKVEVLPIDFCYNKLTTLSIIPVLNYIHNFEIKLVAAIVYRGVMFFFKCKCTKHKIGNPKHRLVLSNSLKRQVLRLFSR